MATTYQEKDVYYLYIWRGEEIIDELVLKGSSDEMIIDKIKNSTKTDGLIEVYKVDKLSRNFKFLKKINIFNNLELFENCNNNKN